MKGIFWFCCIASALSAFLANCNSASSQPSEETTTVSDSSWKFPVVKYMWLSGELDTFNTIYYRFDCPDGCAHMLVEPGSFGEWLRFLPLYPKDHHVLLYNGQEKNRQDVHESVINIDVGKNDLQQCADAVMRLRSEYLFSRSIYSDIHFNFTNGDRFAYTDYCTGSRPSPKGNNVEWIKVGHRMDQNDHNNLASYLKTTFMYAGSLSLSRELKPIPLDSMEIGDVFIHGGTPGHAVIIVDMCQNADGSQKYFMIAQSYMPAQEIHILKNFNDPENSPWYPLHFGNTLHTPEWDFEKSELMRFSD